MGEGESRPSNGNGTRVTLAVLGEKMDQLAAHQKASTKETRRLQEATQKKADDNENEIIRLTGRVDGVADRMRINAILHYGISVLGNIAAAIVGVKVK